MITFSRTIASRSRGGFLLLSARDSINTGYGSLYAVASGSRAVGSVQSPTICRSEEETV
jgi:hypothetical protein